MIVSVWNPTFSAMFARDVSSVLEQVQYEFAPTGCASASLQSTLTWEQLYDGPYGGFFSGRNGLEISTLDDVTARAIGSGATRIYVTDTRPYDPARQLELVQIALYDGAILTVGIPVTGVGTDGTYGPYVTVGAPLPSSIAPGNPSSLPTYGAGTGIYRRRWAGRVGRVTKYHTADRKKATIAGVGIGSRLKECVVNFSSNSLDAGAAVYGLIYNQRTRFSDLNIAAMAQAAVGSTYSGTSTNAFVADVITQIIAAIPADVWVVRVGSDRVPRMVRLYTSSTNAYSTKVTLSNHAALLVPAELQSDSEDTSQMANAVLVIGDVGASGSMQVQAADGDSTSVATYGQIDAAPTTVTGVKDQATCAKIATGLLNQSAYPQQSSSFTIYVRADTESNLALAAAQSPIGLANGDVASGFEAIVIQGFDAIPDTPNWAIDSEIHLPSGPDALWTPEAGNAGITLETSATPDGANAWDFVGASGGYVNGPMMPVAPGQVWNLTAGIDTSAITSDCLASWYVFGVNALTGATTLLATARATAHTASARYATGTFAIPANTFLAFFQVGLGAVATSADKNNKIRFFQPMLSKGSTARAYVPNYAAPAIYGLPSSVVCTTDAGGERSQAFTFAPIEPDINAAIAEQQHALANAILANRTPAVGVDAYVVSPEAGDYAYSATSLSVSFPAYNAQFTKGSTLVPIAEASVTLTAWATTHVWINSDGTYTTKVEDSSAVAGAILIAYFTTNGSGIVGDFRRASYGLLVPGAGNVDVGSLPAPTFSTPTVAAGASANGLAADIDVSIPFTNVPTGDAATMAEFYYRITAATGSGNNAWIAVDGENLARSGSPAHVTAPTQTLAFSYGSMLGGATYDLGVAYRGSSGYGAIVVFASAVTARVIAIGAPYMLGGTGVTPTLTGTGATNGASANGITASVAVTATITNQPTDGSFSKVNFWTRLSSQNNDGTTGAATPGNAACKWSPAGGGLPAVGLGTASPPASGSYALTLSDEPGGQNVDIGLSMENTQGGESNIAAIVENFATVVISLAASQMLFYPYLQSNFQSLEVDTSGNLSMPTLCEIFPGRSSQRISTSQLNNNQFTFAMRFQLTDTRTQPALVAFSDAGQSGNPTLNYLNGYMVQWYNDTGGVSHLAIFKRKNGTFSSLVDASTAHSNYPAVPTKDTSWHTLTLEIGSHRTGVGGGTGGGVAYTVGGGNPNTGQAQTYDGVVLTAFLDGIPFARAYDIYVAGTNSPYTSGYCGPANRDYASETLIDPAHLWYRDDAGTYAEQNAATIAAAIASSGETAEAPPNDNSPIKPHLISRRHNYGSGPGGSHLFNGSASQTLKGWTFADSTGTGRAGRDRYDGGRFSLIIDVGGASGGVCELYQELTGLQPGYTYTVSGNMQFNATATGVECYMQATQPGTGAVLGTSTVLTAATGLDLTVSEYEFTFVAGAAGTAYIIMAIAVYGGSATTTLAQATWNKLNVDLGTVSQPHTDAVAAGLVATTHQVTPDANGNTLQNEVIAGRHLLGAGSTSADTAAVVDANGNILLGRHQVTVQRRIGMHVSCSGQMPYFSSTTVLQIPSTILWIRPDGTYCRVVPQTLTVAANSYGIIVVGWVHNGNSTPGFAAFTDTGYATYATDPAYEILGHVNSDSGSNKFQAAWVNADHVAHVQGVITASGTIPVSSAFNAQGSINGFSENTMSWTSTTNSSGQVTVTWSWSAFSLRFADGSTQAIAASSQSYGTSAGFVGGQTWYWTIWYSTTAGVLLTAKSTAGTASVAQISNQDGNIPVTIDFATSYPVYSGSGGGTSGGGGGGKEYCPAVHQIVETRERGFVRADSVRVGEHLRDYEPGTWNAVSATAVQAGWICDVQIGDEAFCVEIDHLWLRADGNPDATSLDWVRTKDLTLNTLVAGEGGARVLPVRSVGGVRRGEFAVITCANHRYMIGKAVAHNVVTL